MAQGTASRALDVRYGKHKIGRLTKELKGLGFQYDPDWLEFSNAFPLSPCFPISQEKYLDSETSQPVSWFFDNLLPEETTRQHQAAEAGVMVTDVWGMIDYYGLESTGALSVTRPNTIEDGIGHSSLLAEDLLGRLRHMKSRSLICGAAKPISIAGAQPKLPVTIFHAVSEPTGSQSSNYILKPDGYSEIYTNVAANENFCMQLAKEVGLTVPDVEFSSQIWPILYVQRFDRHRSRNKLCRKHVIDGTQLLGVSAQMKYELCSPRSLRACIEKCHDQESARQEVYAWCIFNILIGNGDAHLKNISFYVEHGTGRIYLAPFYDLVSTAVYATPDRRPFAPFWPEVKLSMQIGASEYFLQLTRADVELLGDELGLEKSVSSAILNQMLMRVNVGALALYTAFEDKHSPAERRLLQSIIHLPIREMTSRLSIKPTRK
jgi:HipA-like protein